MGLLRAALAGIIAVLFLPVSPAMAAEVPTITVKLEPRYFADQGNFNAAAVVSGGTASINGVLFFRRYGNPACSGGFDNIGSVGVSGNKEYQGPNLQSGQLGDFGITVFFDSSNTSANIDVTSACVKYLRQQRTSVEMQLSKTRYEAPAKLEPQVTLTGGPADSVTEFERFASSDCTGTIKVITAKVFNDDAIGTHSVRAAYRGNETLAEAVSACRSYTVGTYVRGRVFQDIDSNGLFDEGESGIAGVTVTLRRGQSAVETVQTAADGLYEFYVAATGDYTVIQTQPTGFDSTTPDEITLAVAGTAVVDKNFGEASPEPVAPVIATAAAGTSPPQAKEESSSGFEIVRLLAIALIVIALLTLLVLLYAARARREEEL